MTPEKASDDAGGSVRRCPQTYQINGHYRRVHSLTFTKKVNECLLKYLKRNAFYDKIHLILCARVTNEEISEDIEKLISVRMELIIYGKKRRRIIIHHFASFPLRNRHHRQRGSQIRGLPQGVRSDNLADSSRWPDKLRRLAVPVILNLCGQPVPD